MKEKPRSIARLRNRYLFALDAFILLFIPSLAMLLRLESWEKVEAYAYPLAVFTLCMVCIKLVAFLRTGLYEQYWPYASGPELFVLLKAVSFAGAAELALSFGYLYPFDVVRSGFPRSIPFLSALLTAFLIGGVRLTVRLTFSLYRRQNSGVILKPVVIAGAGVAGAMMAKELQTNPSMGLVVVAFVDDDKFKQGSWIHGVQVRGTLADLSRVLNERRVMEVIIAMPTAPGSVIRGVVQSCKIAGVPSRTIPGLFEILRGTARVTQIRDVGLEDLLRRGTIKTDAVQVASLLKGARVMVTGAGGSIGSEICRQIRDFGPAELVLLGHGETSIFRVMKELSEIPRNGFRICPVIADIRDWERMRQVFREHRPEVVFHAAAHKHVGLMESNVVDAVTNNVLGTRSLVDLAGEFDVKRFVMISSDKAVNPTSVMGVTKRIAELLVRQAAMKSGRPFVTVRFGNVLGSRGSVVPILKRQIEHGGPVTVTHPEVKRFFMTIPEAVQLVLQAATMGSEGETFVLDMGEQIRVADLARDLIRLSGLKEGVDIEIEYTGLLPGEKMYEELFYETDKVERTRHEKIMVCRNGFNGEQIEEISTPTYEQPLRIMVDTLVEAAHQGAEHVVRRLFKKIVPQYNPPDGHAAAATLPVPNHVEEPVSQPTSA